MKNFILSFAILTVFSCTGSLKSTDGYISPIDTCKSSDSGKLYKVMNVDSMKKLYIFLAKKNDSLKCINNLRVGQCYNFLLKSVFPNSQKHRISALRFDKNVVYLTADNNTVRDLFVIQNLGIICE